MKKINLFVKKYKIIFITSILIIVCAVIFGMPSLAKFKNRNTIYTTSSWDGTIATSYKKGDGTEIDPYIISNGSEFAFFIEQLKTTDYNGKYFELSNDIIINLGTFDYDETNKLQYIVEERKYKVKENTNEYYDDSNNKVGTINSLTMIDSFKGVLNGNSFTIYGMYLYDTNQEDLGLFKNLQGSIKNLYIKNSVVSGKGNIAGLAVNSENAVVSNFIYDGFVINKSELKIKEMNIEVDPITSTLTQTNSILNLPLISIEGNIKNIKLMGQYESSNDESVDKVTINGSEPLEKKFTIDLGTSILNEVPIAVTSTIDSNVITFSNLIYKIEYYDDITSGLISISQNTILNNVINKADVYGNYISAGFIGSVKENLQITQGYNTGSISSDYISSGLIGEIKNNSNNVQLTNVYNTGIITGTLISSFINNVENNTGVIDIENSINPTTNYPINVINNSNINILNSYSLNGLTINNGIVNSSFDQTTSENLYKKETLNLIGYKEFVSLEDVETNINNAWIYENNVLPILYIDDLNNPIANLNVNKFSWNNLSSELNYINIEKSLSFSIEEVSVTNPVKEKYYYITPSKVALSKEDLEKITWIPYNDTVTISESGYYVIYVKIIDYDDKTTYINSDIMALDVNRKQTKISMDEYNWETFKTNVDEIYTNKEINISISAQSDLVPIDSIEYYVSTSELSEEKLNEIITWVSYTAPIKITEKGKYIIYAKIIDSEQKIEYINTDFITYNGYNETLTLGSTNKNYNSNYITNNSLIRLNFESNFELEFKEGYTHNLISSILLPSGTEIIIIDKITNKVYKKTIDTDEDTYGYETSCDGISNCSKYATYKFETFKELGPTENNYYDEYVNYNKKIKNEKYTIIVNFAKTSLTENYYDVSFSMEIKNNSQEKIYQTLNNTISNINIYSLVNNSEIITNHVLNSNYANQTINYNSDSELSIDLVNSINYINLNNKNIIDTQYENKKVGLLVKLYDSEGKEINKKYLDNILFEVNGKEYFSNSKNEIRINLGSATNENINTLKIKTKQNSSDLKVGTYYIKINKFISKDGYYYDDLSNDQIIIPLVVDVQNYNISNYNFNVNMNKESNILNNTAETDLVSFDLIYSGEIINPIIKISLYEKEKLSAYNQTYKLVDLANYTTDTLNKHEEGKYNINVSNTKFNLNLMTNKLNNNGYKYVFELYDGSQKISVIEKYFIVK